MPVFAIRKASSQRRLGLAARIGFLTFAEIKQGSFYSPASAFSTAANNMSSSLISSLDGQTGSSQASYSSSGPSLVMKAYALALKTRMVADSDLSLSKQAVFVANIQNRGIPLNTAKEYSNEALYHHANSIQDGTQITFQSSKGDFFEYMNGYMLQVQDDELDAEKITPEIQAYTDLLKLTEKAYKKLLADYKDVKGSDPDYKWQHHVAGPEGAEYRRYWAKRDEASAKLPDSAVVMALKVFDSSHARAESKRSQNMPCVLTDVDLGSSDRDQVDPKDRIFRPAYGLTGFVSTATTWRNKYLQVIDNPEELVLDLETAAETPWRTLGFTNFEDAYISRDTLAKLQEYRVSLTFTGMAAFRITRGLWNIEDFRDFTILRRDAPAKFRTPTFRTDMLLMAYGLQMKIVTPDTTRKPPSILPELLSNVNLNSRGNGLWVSDTPSNDAYPVLLAALASKR